MKKIFIMIFLSLVISFHVYGEENVKKPNVSGQFYPAEKRLFDF